MASTANGFQLGTGAGPFDLNMVDSSQDVTEFSAGQEMIDINIGQNDMDIHGGQDIIDFETFFQIMKEEPGSECASKASKGCMNIDTEVSAPMAPSDSVSPYSQQINHVNFDGHGSSSGESSWQEPPHGPSLSDSSDAVVYNDSIDSHPSDFSLGMRTCFSNNNIQSSLGNLPGSGHKGHIGSSSSISNVNCSWPRNDVNNPDVIELDSSDDDVEVYGNHIANPYVSNVVEHGNQRVLPDTLNIQISGVKDSGRKIPSWAQQRNSKGGEKDFNGAIQAFPNKDGQMRNPLNLSVSYGYAGSAGVLHGNGSARDTGTWDSNYTSNSSAYLSSQGDFQNFNMKDKQTWNDVPMLGNGASIPRLQNILIAPPELSASESNSRTRIDIYEYEYGINGEQEPKLSNCENLSLSSVTETNAWNAGLGFDVKLLTDNRRQLPSAFDNILPPNIIHPHGLLPRHEVRTYQTALMDLDQPTTEMSPDEDLLAVPLLKHQRIGLGWMVEKEKKSHICTGGILADDQGLGKTITTISLILKEQPPSKSHQDDLQNFKAQSFAVDLEEDDVDDSCGEPKPVLTAHNANVKKNVPEEDSMPSRKKGRPSAGTLVICPTSVLRQWAQEIHDKVTQKAKLELLVYHGSNRIKDPEEVAKYDIVLTTYSIVSLEVPKQDDDEQEDADDAGLCDFFTKKPKKKTSESKKKKNKNAKSGSSNDPGPGPLAKVNWFRVVLDEAQTIKNHRTQVSRACWSLRAKRRWCLSGTPIQNSIDDLYSYFRFLRCHTFDSYKNFCQKIKLPVSRNPNTGYKALQALLKTVMLRRTKASIIDGEPIIKLPPKTVDLMKIDFSEEEREFYGKLEADSRAQFKVYAAEGTVKKNYVNILLMLLRLRQACDHPLLVRNSFSRNWISSLKAVRNLPREKQIDLVQHLEGSVALCGICNDAPEDAVISLCYHIFCHQCIADHLAQREDTFCPSPNCKNHLKVDSVFSLNALRHCITYDEKDDVRVPREGDELYSKFEIQDFGSSKIKAAIQTLETISKVRTGVNSISAAVGESDVSSKAGFQDISEPCLKKLVMEKPDKAIVFSQWTSMLDLLESALKKSRIEYRRLDGTMTVFARDKAINDFKTLPQVTVMIMSLKAASLGLNLVAACHVIMLDLWWNPTTEDQAIDRAHRIGQTRPVHVSRFTVRDTVEDRILELQEKKREMVASAFGEDDAGRRSSRLTEEDLHYLFRM